MLGVCAVGTGIRLGRSRRRRPVGAAGGRAVDRQRAGAGPAGQAAAQGAAVQGADLRPGRRVCVSLPGDRRRHVPARSGRGSSCSAAATWRTSPSSICSSSRAKSTTSTSSLSPEGEPVLVQRHRRAAHARAGGSRSSKNALRCPCPGKLRPGRAHRLAKFWPTVLVIELTDIAFAVDSILAAIGVVGSARRDIPRTRCTPSCG